MQQPAGRKKDRTTFALGVRPAKMNPKRPTWMCGIMGLVRAEIPLRQKTLPMGEECFPTFPLFLSLSLFFLKGFFALLPSGCGMLVKAVRPSSG